ncbi:hypothetical protein PIB30_024903 [Stylosanthes scabra]|uniref:Secreted protein n=1 Tax=Stylosanthes scabra TaxID=79078 RepID=A0ABU6SAL7_9FABA|nr:hypothetical protein [Stylosanthes scabra]
MKHSYPNPNNSGVLSVFLSLTLHLHSSILTSHYHNLTLSHSHSPFSSQSLYRRCSPSCHIAFFLVRGFDQQARMVP